MKVDIQEITKQLNLARIEAGDIIFKNQEEFKQYLKSRGLKVGYSNLANKLYNAMCIRGKFIDYPIHMSKVESIYKLLSRAKVYSRKKKVEEKQDILAAIELLKSNGYKVLKPVTEYEEI